MLLLSKSILPPTTINIFYSYNTPSQPIIIIIFPLFTMKLISHNFLLCNAAKCDKNNFPLHIVVEKSQYKESHYNIQNLARLVKKLDWTALRKTVLQLGEEEFPKEPCQELMEDDTFMKRLQRILLDTHILEGRMICPGCNREYPITNGIPNMIIGE